jgi:SpoIID/LytB domain protein
MRRGVLRRAAFPLLVAVLGAGLDVLPAPPATALTVKEVFTRPPSGVFWLQGHGWGHGRGLSQYGAQGAATLGKTADVITSTYYPGTSKLTIPSASIRVQLRSNSDHTHTTVYAASGLTALDVATHAPIPLPTGSRYRISSDSAGLHLATYTTAWGPPGKAYAGPVRFLSSTWVRLAFPDGTSHAYRQAVEAVKTGTTTLQSVAVMSMENYLYGVVPRESLSSWDAAALQAQAVAARSYSGYQRAHAPSTRYYDICDTTQCQVFGGSVKYSSSGTATTLENSSTTNAVKATAGVVRAYQGGPVFAEFSSSNGGWSTAGDFPYLVAKADPWDGVTGSSVHSWSARLPVSALEARYPELGSFRRLTITERDGNGDWGGRVLQVLLEGVDSAGNATSIDATGSGLYYARTWPAYSDGLRSRWFRIIPPYSSTVVSRSVAPRLVLPPGNPRGTLTTVLANTGSEPWPVSGLHLALASPAGGADPLADGSVRPGSYVKNLTHPGAATVEPGDRAQFSIALDATGLTAGTRTTGYRVRIGTAALFGATASWSVAIDAPVFTARSGAGPVLVSTTLPSVTGAPPALFADGRTVVVPRSGSTTLRLTSTDTGNVSWPVGTGSAVQLGTSGPRDRSSASSGAGWLSTTRVSSVAGSAPVAPGSAGTFDLPLHGNGHAAGITTEAFEPSWQGQSWIAGNATSLTVVRVDTAVSRAALADKAPATGFTLVNAPTGTAKLRVQLRNVGKDPWSVGTESLWTTSPAALRYHWPSSTRPPALSGNVTRPGQPKVFPGEVGTWTVPLSASGKAPGTYTMTLRAHGPSGYYGPSFGVTVKVVAAVFSYSLAAVHTSVDVPSRGTHWTAFYVKNTGNVAWPVGRELRSTVIAGSSPSRASSWYSASRPGSLTANNTVPGATLVRPGQIAKFVILLAGNGRTPRTTSELFGMSWDGWRGTSLKVTLAYRVV